jgi:hypothetical protein
VVVLSQDGHELGEGVGPTHIQRGLTVQPAEDAGVVAANEEDLIALQFRVAVDGFGQQLHRSDQDVEVSGRRETAGQSSISMMENSVLRGYQGEARGQGESEVLFKASLVIYVVSKIYILEQAFLCMFYLDITKR